MPKPRFKLNLWKLPILGPLTFACWKIDARRKLGWMQDYLGVMGSHIEIGSGPGSLLAVMRAQGYDVTGLDIIDSSYSEDLQPKIYNGETIPFCKDAFDTALLPTVLHHVQDPDRLIQEAARIARRVIIIEDVYNNVFMEWLTKLVDSVMNLEFIGHPHSNRTDIIWKQSFDRLNLSLKYSKTYPVAGFFKQAIYVLEPRDMI